MSPVRRTWLVRAVLACIVATVALACSDEPAPTKAVVIIFDLSKSASPEVRGNYIAWAEKIFTPGKRGSSGFHLAAGDAAILMGVDANSLTQIDLPQLELSPFDPSKTNRLIAEGKAARELASWNAPQKLRAFVLNEGRWADASKIMDAVLLASRLLKGLGRDRGYLVIFSDMVEESDSLNFAKKAPMGASLQTMLQSEKSRGRIPDLKGVEVYVGGAGAGGYAMKMPTANLEAIRSFWLAYFKEAGSNLPSERYLPTFTGIR